MKASLYLRLTIIALSIIACACQAPTENIDNNNVTVTDADVSVAQPDSFTTGKVVTNIFCKKDSSQSYALYVPVHTANDALPIIYFFDPHGDAQLPLTQYKALADEYHFILAGSGNSKNGNNWTITEHIWESLFADTRERLRINQQRIYTCGFSGGAKVAAYIAMHHSEIKGVIANGAGLPDGSPPGNFNFSFTAVTGGGDMNMTDLVAISYALDKTQTRHRIIFFDGKHEWAPATTMHIAFAGLQSDAMREKLTPMDGAFISNYVSQSKKRVEDYSEANNLLKAEQECELSVAILDGLTDDVNWFKEKDIALTASKTYQKQWQAQQNLLVAEQNQKAVYMQQFRDGDRNYWINAIHDLQVKAKALTAEGDMNQRLLAYLSLAFYSISNQFITDNQNNRAKYFVELYKLADPSNGEAWYLSAILHARSNNGKAAEDDLLKAVTCGFNDKKRIEQQFEFQNTAVQINLAGIEKRMADVK